jgi:Flp pilus assembly pilin Flp
MRTLKQFLKHDGGIAMMEFALLLPFLLMLLIGTLEVGRMLYAQQKVEKVAYVIADVVTRYLPATNPLTAGEISEAEMNTNVFPLFGRIMGKGTGGVANDYSNPIWQAMIVTSISKNAGVKTINWQISSPNATSADNTYTGCDSFGNCAVSVVNGTNPGATNGGVRGRATSFPADIEATMATMPNGENMIITEVFYLYNPQFQATLQSLSTLPHGFAFFLQPRLYVKRTFFVPRNGALPDLPPTFPVP